MMADGTIFIPGAVVFLPVFRQDANFDKACETAMKHAVDKFGVDDCGHFTRVEGADRATHSIVVEFRSYRGMYFQLGSSKTKMANFQDFWSRLCSANPKLRDDEIKMTITAKTFRDSLEKAYRAGTEDKAALIEKLKSAGKSDSSDIMEAFGDLFGGIGPKI